MKVKFLDLSLLHNQQKEQIKKGLDEFFENGVYIGGDYVSRFEKNYAEYTLSKYCCGTSNGLDALILSLKALGIGLGDEVIVPANTFIATWNAVDLVGAKPVPVDCENESYQIDTAKITKAITKQTKAIIGVHLYGTPMIALVCLVIALVIFAVSI